MFRTKQRHVNLTFGRLFKYFGFIIIILFLFFLICYMSITNQADKPKSGIHIEENREFAPLKENITFKGKKFVHLDLKGAPPKISFYEYLMPLLSQLGADGIVIEYEDMFPYTGEILQNVSALNAYTLKEISYINELAKLNNLEVIPLIQTFGHMEFLLKLGSFADMREISEYPQVICPSNDKTKDVLADMISQIIGAHPDSKMIHIGADEVYYIGSCQKCTSLMSKYNLSKNLLFLRHIETIVKLISSMANISILMWDDEFRSISIEDFKKSNIEQFITPVVWKYTPNVYEDLGPSLWNLYSNIFPKVWVASAFKGASGSNQYVSDVAHYIQNHRSWLNVIEDYKHMINFEGIIITGWQRYDHFAVLCELLPVALPSLAINLRLLQGHPISALTPPTTVVELLKCKQPYGLIGSMFGVPKCSYPGSDILDNVIHLQQLKQEFDSISEDTNTRGWINEFNIMYNFSSPEHVLSVTRTLNRIRGELDDIADAMEVAMSEVYDKYTVHEWKITYIVPFKKKVMELWDIRERLTSKESWPRRPVNNHV